METIKLKYNDLLIIDPCYIKHIKNDRFDSLKHIKTIHEGDDGEYDIYVDGKFEDSLGVDSGRIWVIQAEFNTEIEVDAGFSGYITIETEHCKDMNKLIESIKKGK